MGLFGYVIFAWMRRRRSSRRPSRGGRRDRRRACGRRRGRPRRPRTDGIVSTSGIICVMSLRLPPVSATASGVPRGCTRSGGAWNPVSSGRPGSDGLFALQTPARASYRLPPATSRSDPPRAASPTAARAAAARHPPLATRASGASTSSPEPQPISCGRYSHGIAVRNTNKIPVSTFRSSIRFRPGNWCRLGHLRDQRLDQLAQLVRHQRPRHRRHPFARG